MVTPEQFQVELEGLRARQAEQQPNAGCVEVKGCRSCVDCVFCSDCERSVRLRYSIGCVGSYALTHCRGCRDCHACTYSEECADCGDSNYLVCSTGCSQCDYCFGCVGLRSKEFHILNRPYSRAAFFREVKALREALGMAPPVGRAG